MVCVEPSSPLPAVYTSWPSPGFPGPLETPLGWPARPGMGGWGREPGPSPTLHPQMAFRYLSWILFPLLGCYAVYSLLYLEHKGWYSWVLSMLYGFLLTFGERPRALGSPS